MSNSIGEISPCYYFGCKDQPGHYLFRESGSRAGYDIEKRFPFQIHILDSGLLPENSIQNQGEARLVHFGEDWTVISFWDRSVDKRGGSNSSFLIPGVHEFCEAVEISKQRFPWVWSRLSFNVFKGRSPSFK